MTWPTEPFGFPVVFLNKKATCWVWAPDKEHGRVSALVTVMVLLKAAQ